MRRCDRASTKKPVRNPANDSFSGSRNTADFDNRHFSVLLFRGVSNRAVHDYIKTHMTLEKDYDCWKLVTIDSKQYMIKIKKYGSFYGGVWLSPPDSLETHRFSGGGVKPA